jgi:sarcosine oxidase, subunit gamma
MRLDMHEPAPRRSPVHDLLQPQGEGDLPTRVFSLCDLSTLPKLGVKGRGAEAWLRTQGIILPAATYDTLPLDGGGLIVRLGSADFFLEGGDSDSVLPRLSAELARFPPQVYRVERQDSTFLLSGERAPEVLAQVCSIDFDSAPPRRLCLTRVAGINAAILPDRTEEGTLFRLWVDYTLAVYLWTILVEVKHDLGGRVVQSVRG